MSVGARWCPQEIPPVDILQQQVKGVQGSYVPPAMCVFEWGKGAHITHQWRHLFVAVGGGRD